MVRLYCYGMMACLDFVGVRTELNNFLCGKSPKSVANSADKLASWRTGFLATLNHRQSPLEINRRYISETYRGSRSKSAEVAPLYDRQLKTSFCGNQCARLRATCVCLDLTVVTSAGSCSSCSCKNKQSSAAQVVATTEENARPDKGINPGEWNNN
ncbi:hypothetical protein CEXT_284241 [Caerostris extrusa]|uniref:Uncharacterized protein n=1 Tax=Caerostris extrusa TaxID=172846 RepID=A0AAV4XMQ3_CAEEX|nr:hypothetical protein CEXT_284241 [Caerostris extrusa]